MKANVILRGLTIYYGLLQSAHLITLLRGGTILLKGVEMPFPAHPPPEGWSAQTKPFLVAMGLADVVTITLALIFVYLMLFKKKFAPRLGIISLTIAMVSAFIFTVGTFASGAWEVHPVAYWLMAVLFTPVGLLYVILLCEDS